MNVPGELIPITAIICISAAAIGIPLARAWARRIENPPPNKLADAEVKARLERMEHAIDSIAIEIERISEGQRFTTKLLSERGESRASDKLPGRAS
jgi:hypothetical protein